jgi:hypothetical protein
VPDSLRQLVNRYDGEHALRSRVEPDRLVLAPRRPSSNRRICIDCRRPVNEWDEHAQRLKVDPLHGCGFTVGRSGNYRCSSVTECPVCGGNLVEVTA